MSSAAQFANLANVVRTTIARDEAETPTWLPKDARAARKLVNPVEDFKFLLRKLSLPAVMADLKEFQAEKQTPALSPIQSAMLLEADSYMLTLDSDAWTEHFEKYLKQNQAAGEKFCFVARILCQYVKFFGRDTRPACGY